MIIKNKLTESERFLLSARGDKDALGQELSELRLRSEMSAAHYDEQLTQLNYKLQQQQQAIKSVQIECEVNSRVDEATGETTEESSRGLEIVVDEMVAHVETCHTLDAENQRLLNQLADAQSGTQNGMITLFCVGHLDLVLEVFATTTTLTKRICFCI